MELLRRYRFLLFVYGLALSAGLYEFWHGNAAEEPGEVMFELYPDSSEIQYKLARYFESQGDLSKARFHFEQAIATHVKTDENLFWHYALTLIRLDASSEEIDRAVEAWKYNFPDSTLPDPRDAEAIGQMPKQMLPETTGR